jgi:hypothetical protein
VLLVENNDVIETISAYGSDNSLDIGVLPWRPGRCDYPFDTKARDPSLDSITINGIPIAQQIAWCIIERKGFHQLPCRPMSGGVLRDIEVHNLPAIMAEHDKYLEHSKSGSGDSEEVHRRQTICMVFEKCSPGL